MPQIRIYGRSERIEGRQQAISDSIHRCVVEVLEIPQDKRFHRFFPLQPENFFYPPDRSADYLLIEISLFEGRCRETLKCLIRTLFRGIAEDLGIPPHSVEINIQESPRGHWGIRGLPGDELVLPYPIDQSRDLS